MLFKCGIIGLPNVGKSSLFNILTDSSVKAENFPFCTIQANKGFLPVMDIRLYQLSQVTQINYMICENIQLIDIAGLIKGASHGEGLGNKFLHDISEVDVLLHVVRCFNDGDVCHINDEISPEKDIEIIHDELILSDICLCENLILSFEKKKYNNNQYVKTLLIFLKKISAHLYNRTMLRSLLLTMEEQRIIRNYNFLTFKPIIYVANVSVNNRNNSYLLELSSISIKTNIPYILCCVLLENKLTKLKVYNMMSNIDDFLQFIRYSKYFDIINNIYQILQLKTFFTIKNMQSIQAWIVPYDMIAIEAADIIHSDFKKNFIRVQIVKYCDFLSFHGWQQSKNFGKMKIEGKKYLIHDGDILNFLM